MEIEPLREMISSAFPAEPMPSMTLRQATLADESLSREITDEEWEAEGRKDRQVPWRELPKSILIECEVGLPHLDEDSFGYYLPAFLMYSLTELDKTSFERSDLFGTVLFAVTDSSNYNVARLKKLTSRQIDAVVEFLKLVREQGGFDGNEAKQALEGYWETPYARTGSVLILP